jgi:peroxiredoxin
MRWFVMKRFFARLLRTPSWHGRPAHGTRAGCTCHVCAQRVLQKSLAITLVASVLALLKTDMLCAQEIAPPFTRPQLETGEEVSLNDFRGQIVVLDFFNANCGDCVRVSWELETGIQEYYAARAGNPHGIAVQVIAINSEISDESDMEAFLRKTELGMVLDDPEGTLLEAYGGTSLPYLVLVDATAKGPSAATPRVVLRQEKYEGLRKLRGAIDAITGKPEPPRAPTGAPAETAQEPGGALPPLETTDLVTHETTLDVAAMLASDIRVADFMAEYRQERPASEFSLAVSYRPTWMDFRTTHIDGTRRKRLTEDYYAVQGSVGADLNDALTLKLDGGAYDGFSTYRALWMDEYNRLKFRDRLGYRDADPWGCNVSPSLRWEYLPDAGFMDAGVSYQYDKVSPGYQGGPPLVRLRDDYETVGARLSFENVLTRRLRTLLEGRVDETTDRETRTTLQGSANYALAEDWVARMTVSYARERPKFSAKSISAAIERDWRGIWFAGVFGRYYEDTSEVDIGVANDAAAPPLKTYQAGLGVRRQGIRSAIKLDIGPCFSRYDRRPRRNTDFDQLYKDRDWLSVQAAFQYQF